MTDVMLSNYIRNMLSDGRSEQDIANYFTKVMNDTFTACKKAEAANALAEKMEDLVDQMNLALRNYMEFHGIEKSSYDIFTDAELDEAFRNKIKVKSPNVEAPKDDDIVGHLVVENTETGEIEEHPVTEEELNKAWEQLLSNLQDLFSK